MKNGFHIPVLWAFHLPIPSSNSGILLPRRQKSLVHEQIFSMHQEFLSTSIQILSNGQLNFCETTENYSRADKFCSRVIKFSPPPGKISRPVLTTARPSTNLHYRRRKFIHQGVIVLRQRIKFWYIQSRFKDRRANFQDRPVNFQHPPIPIIHRLNNFLQQSIKFIRQHIKRHHLSPRNAIYPRTGNGKTLTQIP